MKLSPQIALAVCLLSAALASTSEAGNRGGFRKSAGGGGVARGANSFSGGRPSSSGRNGTPFHSRLSQSGSPNLNAVKSPVKIDMGGGKPGGVSRPVRNPMVTDLTVPNKNPGGTRPNPGPIRNPNISGLTPIVNPGTPDLVGPFKPPGTNGRPEMTPIKNPNRPDLSNVIDTPGLPPVDNTPNPNTPGHGDPNPGNQGGGNQSEPHGDDDHGHGHHGHQHHHHHHGHHHHGHHHHWWLEPICLPPVACCPPVYSPCVASVCPSMIADEALYSDAVYAQEVYDQADLPVMQLAVGKPATLEVEGLGEKPGTIAIEVAGIGLPTSVTSWSDTLLEMEVPFVGLMGPTPATLHLFDSTGKPIASVPVELVVVAE